MPRMGRIFISVEKKSRKNQEDKKGSSAAEQCWILLEYGLRGGDKG